MHSLLMSGRGYCGTSAVERHVMVNCNVCACVHTCARECVCERVSGQVSVCGDSRPLPGHLVPVTTLVRA